MATLKIPNAKHQISNKSQMSKFNDQNLFNFRIQVIENCLMFEICGLEFN
jgi:hypothetical protein